MPRSMASSSSSSSISLRPWRADSSAASLTTLARSAPVNPGVRRGRASQGGPGGGRRAGGVDPEDVQAALEVGPVDGDLTVEAARAQQGRVEDVGPVGGRDQDHPRLDVEAVHLDQQLVQGMLALVGAAAEAGAALT